MNRVLGQVDLRASEHAAVSLQGYLARRIVTNAGALFGAAAFSRMLRLAVFILVARHLGLDKFGLLAFVMAYAEIFRVAADFGVDTILIRRLAKGEDAGSSVGSAMMLKGALALASFAVGLSAAAALGYGWPALKLLTLGLSGLLLSSGTNLFMTPFQSSLQVHRIAWVGIVGTGLYVLLALGGTKLGQGVPYFIIAGLLADFLAFALGWMVFSRQISPRWGSWSDVLRLLGEALPLGALTILVIGYGRAGMLMLQRLSGPAEVGMYAVGLRAVDLLAVLAGTLAASMYPVLARLVALGQFPRATVVYRDFYRHIAALSTVVVLLIVFAAKPLLGFLGPAFVPASPTLAMLVLVVVFMFVNQLSASLMLAVKLERVVMVVAVWNLVFDITLNVLLIPRYGAFGAATALLITEGVNMLVQSGLVWRRFRIAPPLGLWLRVAVTCALAMVFLMNELRFAVLGVLVVFAATAAWKHDVSLAWLLRAARLPLHHEEVQPKEAV